MLRSMNLADESDPVTRRKTIRDWTICLTTFLFLETVTGQTIASLGNQQQRGTGFPNSYDQFARFPFYYQGSVGAGFMLPRWQQPGSAGTSIWVFSSDRRGSCIG